MSRNHFKARNHLRGWMHSTRSLLPNSLNYPARNNKMQILFVLNETFNPTTSHGTGLFGAQHSSPDVTLALSISFPIQPRESCALSRHLPPGFRHFLAVATFLRPQVPGLSSLCSSLSLPTSELAKYFFLTSFCSTYWGFFEIRRNNVRYGEDVTAF